MASAQVQGRIRAGGAVRTNRLDRSTLLDALLTNQPAERRFKVRHWAKQGVIQIGWGIYKPEQPKQGVRVLTPEERKENQLRSTRRACAHIRRDLLSISADRLLTLTYRENMTDRQRALTDLTRFNRAMRQRFEHWSSVAVLEWQKRGSAHFHLGISGFYPVQVVRECWLSVVGENNGNIDIAFKPDGKGNQYTKLATYMGKYLAKDLDEGRQPGDHRYFRCQIGEQPIETYYIPATSPLGVERGIALEVIQEAFRFYPLALCGLWVQSIDGGRAGYASAEINTKSIQSKGV